MPLPDFLKRRKGQPLNPSNGTDESPTKSRPEHDSVVKKVLPLENLSEELFTNSAENGNSKPDNSLLIDSSQRVGGLAKSINDVLSNPSALGYFIQFMESRGSVALVKFCLEVESFRASKVETPTTHARKDSNSDFGNFQSADEDGINCDTTNQHQSNLIDDHDTVSPLKTATTTATVTASPSTTNGRNSSPSNSDEDNSAYDQCPMSPSCESIDSGILVNGNNNINANVNNVDNECNGNNGNTNTSDDFQNLNTPDQLLINNALSIYQKYVAPESPLEIEFPLPVRHSIVTGICSESGNLDQTCFNAGLEFVKSLMEKQIFPEFLQSEFNAKYQVDVLSQDGGRHVTILDILENEVLLFHFMEFLENSGDVSGRQAICSDNSLLEFWISANNFRQQASILLPASMDMANSNSNVNEASLTFLKSDAVAIYDKFISLEASSPLGFSSAIRSRIEEKICSQSGLIAADCFNEALQLVVRVLHMKYVQKFINSHLFKNYLAELRSIIASAAAANASGLGRLKKDESMTSLNTSICSDSGPVSISCQNTLLASSSSNRKQSNSGQAAGNVRTSEASFFLDSCWDSDHLWRRKQTTITNIGHVDSLGRYKSNFEAPPDMDQRTSGSGAAMGVKLSRAVRRMITNVEVERHKEEMAWQMASMIVKDVTARSSTLSPETKQF